jgi:hypothetical protein
MMLGVDWLPLQLLLFEFDEVYRLLFALTWARTAFDAAVAAVAGDEGPLDAVDNGVVDDDDDDDDEEESLSYG